MNILDYIMRSSRRRDRNYYFLNWGFTYAFLGASITFVQNDFSVWGFAFALVGLLSIVTAIVRTFKLIATTFALLSSLALLRGLAYLTPLFTVFDTPFNYGAGILYIGVGLNHLIASGVQAADKREIGEDTE